MTMCAITSRFRQVTSWLSDISGFRYITTWSTSELYPTNIYSETQASALVITAYIVNCILNKLKPYFLQSATGFDQLTIVIRQPPPSSKSMLILGNISPNFDPV